MKRSESISLLRSPISIDTDKISLELEQFQNSCLRPILKFQNDILVSYFKSSINLISISESTSELENLVKNRLQKDLITRNTLLGMIIGLLHDEEMTFYMSHKNELNKRLVVMLTQRITDNLIHTNNL